MKLEDYINKRRQELDADPVDDRLIWEGIRSDLSEKQSGLRLNLWKAAAILILIGSVSYILVSETNIFNTNTPLARYNSEFGKTEMNYQQIVKAKYKELESLHFTNDELLTILFEELQLLDTIYKMAIDDLNTSGYQERIVLTIFDTYEKRINVLERIIFETQKKSENEENKIQEVKL